MSTTFERTDYDHSEVFDPEDRGYMSEPHVIQPSDEDVHYNDLFEDERIKCEHARRVRECGSITLGDLYQTLVTPNGEDEGLNMC